MVTFTTMTSQGNITNVNSVSDKSLNFTILVFTDVIKKYQIVIKVYVDVLVVVYCPCRRWIHIIYSKTAVLW